MIIKINHKIFLTLLIVAILAQLALIPYALSIGLMQQNANPWYLFVLKLILGDLLLYGFCISIGLILANKVGLGLPLLEKYFDHKEIKTEIKPILKNSIFWGIIISSIITLFDLFFQNDFATIPGNPINYILNGFITSLYEGINEEIIFHLFLMSFLVWLIYKIRRTNFNSHNINSYFWIANIISAIIFGILHLPSVLMIKTCPVTLYLILRVSLLNIIAMIILGWLYWKKGLESAIFSHIFAGIILYVIIPSTILLSKNLFHLIKYLF